MDSIEFKNVTMHFLYEAMQRLESKGNEYKIDGDRYSQLAAQAMLNNMTIEEVIQVLMTKHLSMLCNIKHEMKKDEFKERALDVIAYLCLMNGCYEEVNNL